MLHGLDNRHRYLVGHFFNGRKVLHASLRLRVLGSDSARDYEWC